MNNINKDLNEQVIKIKGKNFLLDFPHVATLWKATRLGP